MRDATNSQASKAPAGVVRGVQRGAVVRVQERGVAHVVRAVQRRVQARKVLSAPHMHCADLAQHLLGRARDQVKFMADMQYTWPVWLTCP